MTDKDDFLEQFFDDARSVDAKPSADLQARVLADAARMAPIGERAVKQPAFWSSLIAFLGGWPALGGLAAAGVAGLWLGLAPPVAIESFAADVLGTTTEVSFFPSIDDVLAGEFTDG